MNVKKQNRIRILSVIGCILFTALVIFLCSVSKNAPASENSVIDQNPMASQSVNPYEPADDIVINGSEGRRVPPMNYVYKDEMAKIRTLEEAAKEGYKVTSEDYSSSSKLVLSAGAESFLQEYSQVTRKTQKVETAVGHKGGTVSKYVTETEDAPLLEPYYGYIILTAKGKKQLLDSNGKVLISSFGGYEPAYRLTMFGEPLFIKEGAYYYYHTEKNKNSVFYTDITKDTYAEITDPAPSSYSYLDYDYYITLNYLTNGIAELPPVKQISYEKPEGAAMVEYILDETTLYTIGATAYKYTDNKTGLYPFFCYQYAADFTIEKVLWGYMDAKGDVVIAPQFNAAYSFSEEGYAVVEDVHGHICFIDKKGAIVYNPYDTPLFIPEMGNKKIRDTFSLPDTYGAENTGMFTFDHGYTMVRRQLIDTESGFVIKRELKAVVSPTGEYLNYPSDCNLIAYSSGMLLLEKDGFYGYMNYLGEWIVKPTYRYAEPFSEGLAVVGYRPDKLGVIDTAGNMVLPYMFTNISSCSGGVITAYEKANGWAVFQKVCIENAKKEEETVHPLSLIKTRAVAQALSDYSVYAEEKKKEQQAQEQSAPLN